ncbi:hypothetical protein [Streptomyces sp. NBC_00887]|uniref:hypothetical protein n=1 Tax=Streptomyces sp. NBC_00887 TaxID=2975859 RepID=UPI00386A4538|nr:hypothetical protein OG844_31220 [Streptomyces sp. NBC_00887]
MRTPVENWREGTRTGHTHEANDVTVQLDGLGRQLAELPVEPTPPDNIDGPVFVDESGRRSKTYRRLGWVLAAICAVYAVTLVVAVLGGNSSAPWLPLSGQEEKKSGEAEVRPAPSDGTGSVAGTPGPTPSSTASGPGPSTGATASGGASAGPASSGAGASASASNAPSKGNDVATQPAPGASASETQPASPPPSTDPGPAESSPPPPEESSAPPVVQQEGAQ